MIDHVTLSDVADAAGVSLATASRAVNGNAGRSRLSAEHRRIAKIADDLGYVPDAAAQAVARGRTSTLGLIVSDINDLSIINTLYDVVAAAADADGLSPSMTSAAGAPELLAARARDMHRQRARSLVIAAVGRHALGHAPGLRTALDAFSRSGGSVCTIGFGVDGTNSVTFDDEGGARSLASLLHATGYRTPAIVVGSRSDPVHEARRRGALDGFARRGCLVAPDLVVDGPDEYTATRRLLARTSRRPDVIVCVSPLETGRVVAAVLESGLTMPGDVALAVCGDAPTTTRHLDLTQVNTPWREAAERAVAVTSEHDPDRISTRSIVLAPYVTLGSSTPSRTT